MIERELTTIEHLFAYSPFSIVSLIARIKGEITKEQLTKAISGIQKKHPPLQSRIVNNNSGILLLKTDPTVEIPFKILKRETSHQWMKILEEESKIPFDFDKHPPIRFILLQSPELSELIIICHHIICDGLSLAFLARDLITALGNPGKKTETLSVPIPISIKNFPSDVSMNWIVKFFINRMNKKWEIKKVLFNQEDYIALSEAYWTNFHHKMISIELSESQTTDLLKRCKANNVSVNSALTTAFVGAQVAVQAYRTSHSSIGIAADLRNRLPVDPGENMGFYAGMIKLKIKYDQQKEFWENARYFQKKIKPKFTNKNLFNEFLSWLHLYPSIMTAINFKKLGGSTNKDNAVGEKLSNFSRSKDVISSIIKRDKTDSFTHKILGTAVTNLTKMDFPGTYGNLELDRLILHPGGAFPLGNVNIVLGAVTCSGKLSLIIEYAEKTMDKDTAEKIKEKAMNYLSVTI